jgi:hypothetical protein
MAKRHSDANPQFDEITTINSWEYGEVVENDDPFWEEFFKIEDLLCMTDELDPPKFSITVQNHQTGDVRTYKNIRLKSSRKKLVV